MNMVARAHELEGSTVVRDHRYLYSADDERLATIDALGGTTTWRLRGLDGKVLREYRYTQSTGKWSWKGDWIWREGQLLSTSVEFVR